MSIFPGDVVPPAISIPVSIPSSIVSPGPLIPALGPPPLVCLPVSTPLVGLLVLPDESLMAEHNGEAIDFSLMHMLDC
jgi:hypothetical protein